MVRGCKIGIAFAADTSLSVSDIIDCARLAERKGFDAVWVAEGRGPDAFSVLTAVALNTERICLGAGIIPIFSRSPWLIAMGTAVADQVSNGRFTLGLGPSHKSVVEKRHGLVFEKPTQRLREVASIVRLALKGGVVNYEGEVFRISGAHLSFKPRRSEVPIYVAAMRPRMLQLAGEIADGALLIFPTRDYVKGALKEVREGARMVNRNAEDLDIASYVFTCVSKERRTAIEASRKVLAYYGRLPNYYDHFSRQGFPLEAKALEAAWARNDISGAIAAVTDELVLAFSASGTPDEVAKKIDEFAGSGVEQIVLYPYAAEGDTKRTIVETIEALAR